MSRADQLGANVAALEVAWDDELVKGCEELWWQLPRRPVTAEVTDAERGHSGLARARHVARALADTPRQLRRAAAATVDDAQQVHSLRAYFIRRGDHTEPIRFEVDRIRNGRSFTTRCANSS